jgi:endonuclease YncB( thermonuclease family)
VGIDAPERKQPFHTLSRQNLADMVFGKEVAVEWHKRDRYKCIPGKVLLDGQDINLAQIRAGLKNQVLLFVAFSPGFGPVFFQD